MTFRIESRTPYPYMCCYCSICRKTAGGGGFAINIMGLASTFEVEGEEHLRVYQAPLGKDPEGNERGRSSGQRHFCGTCGSALFIRDPRWPKWVYPFASAIDTELPKAPELVHILEMFAAPWVHAPTARDDQHFAGYPQESIEDWHAARGLTHS